MSGESMRGMEVDPERVSVLDRMRKLERTAIPTLVLAALAASCSPRETHHQHETGRVAQGVAPERETEKQDFEINWQDMDSTGAFFEEDRTTGEFGFNPWSLITPIQVELPETAMQHSEARIKIPYEYSRLFNSAKALSPEDHEKLVTFVEGEIKSQFVTVLHGLDVSKRVYDYEHHGESPLAGVKILSLDVSGLSSPEGPEQQGPSTLAQGVVDPENIHLGEERGIVGLGLTGEALAKNGIDISKLNPADIHLNASEVQFSDEELSELTALASAYPGADDIEKIFNLVVDYNDGTVTDPGTKAVLDEIIGSKRGVEVTIQYEGNKKEVDLIPIPLIPLLLLAPLAALRRRRREQPPAAVKKSVKSGGPGDVTPRTPEITPPRTADVSEGIRTAELPAVGTREYEEMAEKTLLDDIAKFANDIDTIARGLSYNKLMAEIEADMQSSAFTTVEELELHYTKKLLEAWRVHDIACRRQAGNQDLESGLDYENQPRQIMWAKMHAKIMANIVQRKVANRMGSSLQEELERATRALAQRRERRNGGNE